MLAKTFVTFGDENVSPTNASPRLTGANNELSLTNGKSQGLGRMQVLREGGSRYGPAKAGPHVGGSGGGGEEPSLGKFSKLRSSEIGFRSTEAPEPPLPPSLDPPQKEVNVLQFINLKFIINLLYNT